MQRQPTQLLQLLYSPTINPCFITGTPDDKPNQLIV